MAFLVGEDSPDGVELDAELPVIKQGTIHNTYTSLFLKLGNILAVSEM